MGVMLTTSGTSNKTCCSVLYGLKTLEHIVRDVKLKQVTVVNTRMLEPLSSQLQPIALV